MANWCDKCGSIPLCDCEHSKAADALTSARGQLAARLLEARIRGWDGKAIPPQASRLAASAVARADALIKELLK